MSVQASPIGAQIERIERPDCEGDDFDRPMFSIEQLRVFKPVLSFLNAKDRDILYLVFVSGKKQHDIQEILGRSQPSLSYDIKRIRRRLKFIFYLNSVFDIFVNFIEHPPEDFESFEIEVLMLMFYTSSFTLTSEILDVSQVKVRYSFDKCLRKLEESEMWEVYEIFMTVRSNLNLIRRVCRPNDQTVRTADIYIPQ